MNPSDTADLPSLSFQQTKDLALEVVAWFERPEVTNSFQNLREQCGGDMYKFFAEVVPWSTTEMAKVTESRGFPPTQQGVIHFMSLAESYKGQDHELDHALNKVKSYFTQPHH